MVVENFEFFAIFDPILDLDDLFWDLNIILSFETIIIR